MRLFRRSTCASGRAHIPLHPVGTHICGRCGQQWVGTHVCGAIGPSTAIDQRDAEIHRLLDEVTRLERENDELRTAREAMRAELGVANDLVAELQATNARLVAKCEERKAVLGTHEHCFEDAMDHQTYSRDYCRACESPRRLPHGPDCAWQHAMEDA